MITFNDFLEESRTNLRVGKRVSIRYGSGTLSGKSGTIVNPREVKTDGKGVPTNVAGAYKPVDWSSEVAIRLDGGELVTMYKERVIPIDFYLLIYPDSQGGWVLKHSSLSSPSGGGQVIENGLTFEKAVRLAKKLRTPSTEILKYKSAKDTKRSQAIEVV